MGKEMSLVKSSPIIALAFLAGCGNDASISANTDKDPEMFLEILMGKKPKQTYVIASPMAGTLMQNGKPLAQIKIIRSLSWTGKEGRFEQEFTTDEQGRFSMPAYEEQLVLGKLTQFACTTYLAANVDGERFDIWFNDKYEEGAYVETGGRQLGDLICDLNSEEVTVKSGFSRISTVCRWADMPPESEF
jgi:hypothetical protein